MNYFEKVDLTAVDTEIEGLKDLQLKVEEKSTGQIGLVVVFHPQIHLLVVSTFLKLILTSMMDGHL